MKHFGLRAYQQFHISTERILRFLPYSSTFDSFQLFFSSIFQDPAVLSSSHLLFLLLFIHLPCSCAHFPLQHLLILRSLILSVCLFLIPDVHLVCVLLQIVLIVVFMHSPLQLFCSIRLSVSNSSELPVLRPLCLTAKRPKHREKRDGGREGWLNGEHEYGMRGRKKQIKITFNFNCCSKYTHTQRHWN